MINQRIFLNVLDEEQKPVPGCRVKIENRKDKFEADTDYSGIVEFLVPLGVYVLSLEHSLFKKKVYRMNLRDGFSFTRIILQRNNYSIMKKESIKREPIINLNEDTNENINSTYIENEFINNSKGLEDEINISERTYENENNEPINFSESIENIANTFMKTDIFKENGLFAAMGGSRDMGDTTFDDILSEAKSILQDIMQFAEKVNFDNSQYTEPINKYDNDFNMENQEDMAYNRQVIDEEWKPERIETMDFQKNYENQAYDVYDYEEEFFEPTSGYQGQ